MENLVIDSTNSKMVETARTVAIVMQYIQTINTPKKSSLPKVFWLNKSGFLY